MSNDLSNDCVPLPVLTRIIDQSPKNKFMTRTVQLTTAPRLRRGRVTVRCLKLRDNAVFHRLVAAFVAGTWAVESGFGNAQLGDLVNAKQLPVGRFA